MLLPTRVPPCLGKDGEMLLGHVVHRPSESGMGDRHYAQLCSGLPILPRDQEPLSIQTPVTRVLQEVGGSLTSGCLPLPPPPPVFLELLTLRTVRARCWPAGDSALP